MNNKITNFIFIGLICSSLAACNLLSPSDSKTATIVPGDKIGDFLISTGERGNFIYAFKLECAELKDSSTVSCEVPVGTPVNVSTGIYDETGGGKLDQVWSNSEYKMFINDRPVDVNAFGTIDYADPTLGKIRFANVVISTDKPGEITVRDSGVLASGEAFDMTSTYVFKEP